MRSFGPGKVLLIETTGPLEGSYVEELRKSLPKALEMVPPSERLEIRFFVSDGRPVMANPARTDAPHNSFADYLQELNNKRRGSGIVYADRSLPNVDRAIPNWGNPQVVDHFIRERIEPLLHSQKSLASNRWSSMITSAFRPTTEAGTSFRCPHSTKRMDWAKTQARAVKSRTSLQAFTAKYCARSMARDWMRGCLLRRTLQVRFASVSI